MTQTYIEYMYVNIFPESASEKVSDRTVPKELPKRAFAFRFFEKTEMQANGETLIGQPKNYSGWHYENGEVLTVNEVKKKYPDKNILISNMENNNIEKVIMTKYGQSFFLKKGDTVLNY